MAKLVKARIVKGGWSWGGRTTHVGDAIEASEAQISAWERGGYVERVGASAPAPPEPNEPAKDEPAQDANEEAPGSAGSGEQEAGRAWPHKISPEQYANRFPDGPDADLARSLLGKSED